MEVRLLGIPFDNKSSFLKGPAKAPDKIREVLHSGSSNHTAENGIDIIENLQFKDLGNISPDHYSDISDQLSNHLIDSSPYILLGGDHSVTYPIVKHLRSLHGPFNILHVDAHSDLYHEFEGDKFSHACPFARIMEENLASRLVQIGIRTLNKHQKQQADKFGVEIITMREIEKIARLQFEGPIYLSVDLDGFDPAYAPGVSHLEPGGLSPRTIIDLIHSLNSKIIGADIVELNPLRDINDITAALSAKLLKEIAAKMAAS